MNLHSRLELFLIFFWIQSGFMPGILCNNAIINHLSRQDILLLKDEPDPKCFTRTLEDFTCFFETADNRTCDFLYSTESQKKRCEMSVQRTEEGRFLHVCSFPTLDVFVYVETYIEVVEKATNRRIHNRTVSVEEHILVDPPSNVFLNPNGHAGQLQVSWHKPNTYKYFEESAKIRYSSRSLVEKTKNINASTVAVLHSLKHGEELEVQVSVKFASNPQGGHWSSWSHPVRAMVPQTASDISLTCHTSDLQNISCHWDGTKYVENEFKLFYKMGHSETWSWTEWTECVADKNQTDWCLFHGDPTREVKVKLNSTSASNNRTFYTEVFTLNKSIKTSPPGNLRLLKNEELCLEWDAPFPSLSSNLEYEVNYKIKGGKKWVDFSNLKEPKTHTCPEVLPGKKYRIKVRARPNDTTYSGPWSDWSDEFTGGTPPNTDLWLVVCVPAILLIITIIIISSFFSRLKLYFWPPVPNLDKVLQGFLVDMSNRKWDLPVTTKLCCEETASSVVKIMSEEEVSGLLKPSEDSPEGSVSSGVQVDGSPVTDVFPDYVTLNENSGFFYTEGNSYVCEKVREKKDSGVGDELPPACQGSCPDGSVCNSPGTGNDFLNHSYLPFTTQKCTCTVTATRGPGNLYTNITTITGKYAEQQVISVVQISV